MEAYFKNSYKNETPSLPLIIKNVGFQKCTPGYQWGPGVRDHYLIHYVVSGKGVFTVGAKSFDVSPGQLFLVWPNTVVSYRADDDTPWEYYWLGFSGPEAAALMENSRINPRSPVADIDFGADFRRYITDIYDSRGRSLQSRAQMLGYAYLLLAKLTESGGEPQPAEMAEKAAEFIENNYSDQITVDDIARTAGVSRSWLHRCFVRRFGISPTAHLRRVRMEQAKYLLESTGLRISEVACSVGYADALYFSRVFSGYVGESPTMYREKSGHCGDKDTRERNIREGKMNF